MEKKPKGKLMIIGGAEKSDGNLQVLEALAENVRRKQGPLVIVTVASTRPHEGLDEYRAILRDLGVRSIQTLDIPSRDDAYDADNVRKVAEASGIFFTGGDQLRITSQVGDSPVYRAILDRYYDGALIAGSSAGAAAMPDTMITGGPGDESNEISALSMAPGLGLIHGIVTDSHFAQRGRMGRLLGAVAQNPRNLGLGIDEATAVLISQPAMFTVVGPGAVYIVDGAEITYSSLSEDNLDGVVTIHDIKLHVLDEGDYFDLAHSRPLTEAEAKERIAAERR
jgi:cyanophycinase